jgi:micrococcal nuclease
MAKKKKQAAFPWKKLVIAAIATSTIGGAVVATTPASNFFGEKVVEVVDGDTLFLENRQPIRLYGLDAPELENCLGQEAKKALSLLVLNKRVFIKEPLSDRNGRVMALVYQKGILVNEVLIKTGLAQYQRDGESQTKRMKAASDYARENSIGIFSPLCYQTEPEDPKCAIKGNYDERKAKQWYFTPSCPYYSNVIVQKHQGDNWFCTEKEAKKAGFTKSPNCK